MVKNFMTKKEKKIQIALGTYLDSIWNDSNKLCDKGYKLWDEGNKLRDEGNKLWDKGDKLWDKGYKLRDKGYKLRDKGYKLRDKGYKLWDKGKLLFTNAVIEVYGKDITIKYMYKDKCILSNGQVFE